MQWYHAIYIHVQYTIHHTQNQRMNELPHHRPHIPHIQTLIPSHTRTPSLTPKQTPIHPRHKLCMPAHPPQLNPHIRPRPSPHHIDIANRPRRCLITPSPTRHIITGTQQHIRQMRRPRHLPNRILMSQHHRLRSLPGRPNIKRANRPIHPRRSYRRRPILVPIHCQRLRRRRRRHRSPTRHYPSTTSSMNRHLQSQMIRRRRRRP